MIGDKLSVFILILMLTASFCTHVYLENRNTTPVEMKIEGLKHEIRYTTDAVRRDSLFEEIKKIEYERNKRSR